MTLCGRLKHRFGVIFSLAAGRASEMYSSRKVNMMLTTAYADDKDGKIKKQGQGCAQKWIVWGA